MPRKKETFLLVSLNEKKAKELAQAVSNKTCRKILDHLADNEATESELAKKLGVPISTVHYNLQQLQKGGLVESEEYHYSEKGKEVNHYRLANKYIIIAPKTTYGIKEKLRSILPVGIIAAGAALFIQFFSNIGRYGSNFAKKASLAVPMADEAAVVPQMAEEAAEELVMDQAEAIVSTGAEEAGRAAPEALNRLADSAAEIGAQEGQKYMYLDQLAEAAPNATAPAVPVAAAPPPAAEPALSAVAEPSIWQNIALWFFIGAVFALLIYLLINWLRSRKK